jgi:NADH:ubiquinone oxidoreductase subunit E
MGRVNGHTAEQVIDSIRKNHGILAAAARDLGVTRNTVYRYVKNYPTVEAALEDERQIWIDMAESELIKAVKKGNITAIMFFLKTVGRNRGYVERQEITGKDDGAIIVTLRGDGDKS